MIRKVILQIWLVALVALSSVATADSVPSFPFQDHDQPIAKRVDDLLGRLTLDEKASLVRSSSSAIPRLGIRAYQWWAECLHGVTTPYNHSPATCFPQAMGMASSWDIDLIHTVGDCISDEARARHHHDDSNGLTFFTPNINILRDPRWGRGLETYGEDPCLTGRMGVAFITGLQGDDLKYLKIGATAKHFAMHSGPESQRRHFNAIAPMRDIYETYLPAFKAAAQEAHVVSFMSAYNEINGVPCTANHWLLDDLLRTEWGFTGYVISDDQAAADVVDFHHAAPTQKEGGALVLNNGCDLELGSRAFANLAGAVRDGLVTESRLDEACRRLLTVRFRLGEFDPAELVPYAKIPYSVVGGKLSISTALQMARESLVLLKNEDGILPLSANKLKTIAIIGPNADNPGTLTSTYFWSKPTHLITPLQAIRSRLGDNVKVIYARGCDWTRTAPKSKTAAATQPLSAEDLSQDAVNAITQSDAAIVFLGLCSDSDSNTMEGEGADRRGIKLPEVQETLLKTIQALGKPVVLVLMNGGPVSSEWAQDHVPGILEAWYPGQEGGIAVTEALFGDYNPGGRLPCTFYKSESDIPSFINYSMEGRTYRYFNGTPLYPFGFGQSYTTFAYANLHLDKDSVTATDSLQATVQVTNTGARDGDEVVEVYVRKPDARSFRPIRQLSGFRRVHIPAGKSVSVTVPLRPSEWRYWDDKTNALAMEPGGYEIEVGNSSADIRLRASVQMIRGKNGS